MNVYEEMIQRQKIERTLNSALVRLCRHAGFSLYLFEHSKVQGKLDGSVSGAVFKHMLEATLDMATVVMVRTAENDGCVQRSLEHAATFHAICERRFEKQHLSHNAFQTALTELRDRRQTFIGSEIFRQIKLYRIEAVAHEVWEHGSRVRELMEEKGTLPAAPATYNDLTKALLTSAQLCKDARALFCMSPICPEDLVRRMQNDARIFWTALPDFAEVEQVP